MGLYENFSALGSYILDPIIRGPLFSCTLLGGLCAIMGCIVVLKRESLIGETIAHACYPGAVLWAFFLAKLSGGFSLLFFGCATVSALIGVCSVRWLVFHKKTSQDAALSAVLSSAMAGAFLFISGAQVLDPSLWKKAQALLLGQAATMGDIYIFLSIILFFLLIPSLFIFRRNLVASIFDSDFAKMTFVRTSWMEGVFLVLLVFLVVCSVRAMGAILVSALLILPAISARYFTKSFSGMLFVAALIGGISSFFGVIVSDLLSFSPHMAHAQTSVIPTGSCIVLFLISFFLLSLFFSPGEGIFLKAISRYSFYLRCEQENLIKHMWKECFATQKNKISLVRLRELWPLPRIVEWISCKTLLRKKYIKLSGQVIEITPSGLLYGRKLVRLHRLWELYLVEFCGVPKERVHPSAEEMEHRITPEIEKELSSLLHDPSLDPHKQPIPSSVEVLLRP